MFNPAFWWTLAGIALIVGELLLPGVILIFFGLGALITALLAWLLPISFPMQLFIFALASVGSLVGLRRFLKRAFTGGKKEGSEAESIESGLMGEEGTVAETIAPNKPGRVLVHGTDWSAEAGEELAVGTIVEVVGQKSLRLKVKQK